MTDAPTLTIESFLHGARVWRLIGEREHIRRDGRQTVLGVWQSSCTICGEAFEVETPRNVETAEGSKRFLGTTCPAHRLSPSEVAELRFAPRAERRAVFEALKQRKLEPSLAAPDASTRPMTLDPARRWRRFRSRDRAEQIWRFRELHPDVEDLSDEQIEAILEMQEHETDDDDLSREQVVRISKFREHHPEAEDASDEMILRVIAEVDADYTRLKRPN